MPQTADPISLSFAEPPLRLRLEGFAEETARDLAHQWLSAVETGGVEQGSYRIRLETDPGLRFSPPRPNKPLRPVRLQTQKMGRRTELRMSGARILLTAGKADASVGVYPDLMQRPSLIEIAAGPPLGHALALAGASFLHGAAFLVHNLPVLLLGGSGAGKSTVAAASLAADGAVVSDDSLILYSAGSKRLAVRPLRRSLFLREGSVGVLPERLRQRLRRVGPTMEPRWELDRDRNASAFKPSLEPAALCVLRQDRRLKSFKVLHQSQASAFTALLESNSSPHLLDPAFGHERRNLIELWSRLVAEVPAFELRLGRALLDSPAEVLGDVADRLRELSSHRT